MLGNKKLFFVVISVLMVSFVTAQNTTSPYSRYGYGVLKDRGIGASKGMGGISYGIRGQNTNPGNPASYSAVDSLTFIFDMGVSYSKGKLSDSSGSQNDDNGGLDYITMLFPLSKKLGLSFGILPYSSVGYNFGSVSTFSDGTSSQQYYSGTGNLSQIYGGIGYSTPIKGLSIGANVAYLYGTLEHDRILTFSLNTVKSRVKYSKMTINAAKFDIGMQYQMDLPNKKSLTLGAVFSPQISPSTRVEVVDITVGSDTVQNTSNVDSQLPLTVGAGFTYSNKRNFLVGADVTFQKWKDLDYPGGKDHLNDSLTTSNRFDNRMRFNAGVEYVVDPFDRNFFKRLKLRAGVNYSNSYLNARESSTRMVDGYKEYGATIGFGIPMARDVYTQRVSYVNLSFEYTRLKPNVSTMIKEEYFGVSLNVNINDLWFMKNKFK